MCHLIGILYMESNTCVIYVMNLMEIQQNVGMNNIMLKRIYVLPLINDFNMYFVVITINKFT